MAAMVAQNHRSVTVSSRDGEGWGRARRNGRAARERSVADAVAAGFLGAVQRGIGGGDQRLLVVARFEAGDAE